LHPDRFYYSKFKEEEMRKTSFTIFALLLVVSMLLASCAPATPAAPAEPQAPAATEAPAQPQAPAATEAPAAQAPAPTEPPAPTATVDPNKPLLDVAAPMEGRVPVYWYIGLGAGAQPAQIPQEKAFVDKYNNSQSEIQLIPVIIDNKYASDNLTAQIAAGNAPDIVGPVGAEGRALFPGAFLDLEPLIKEANYNTSDLDPAFLEFYKEQGKLVGLPFAIYPETLYVNKDLFKEAGLPLPPQKYGEKYTLNGKQVDWTFDTMSEVAKILTVDKNGNDATSPDFDAKSIVQYGYVPQWTSDNARAIGTLFGASMPIDAQGNAVISDNWKAAWKWYYDGVWGKQPFIPDQAAYNSDALGKTNAFSSGKIGMASTHVWYTCCIDPKVVPNWDLAIMPSYNGKVTSKMHGDTFAIMSASKHPKEAFKVYTYMLNEGSAELYTIYGGMPARKADQAAFFKSLDEKFAPNKVNWQVAIDSIPFMDIPNHQLGLPNQAKALDLWNSFGQGLRTQPVPDLDAAIADFIAKLDQIYKSAPK
jgi:multiple sugar transport system substrate-binding protein